MSETWEYTGVVQSVGPQKDGKPGWALALKPREGMEHPDWFYGEDWGLVKALEPGKHVTLVLLRGRLKPPPKGKPARSPDSTKWWDFYQELQAVKEPQAVPAPPKAATPATSAARPIPTAGDSRDASIERQVASKNRTELALACLQQAVIYHDRLPDGNRVSWADAIAAARLAYDEFVAETEVLPPLAETDEGPDTSADELPF